MLGWLKTSYIGQPFGTLTDYLGAFTWGFGAQTTLDATLSYLGRIGRPPTVSSGSAPATNAVAGTIASTAASAIAAASRV